MRDIVTEYNDSTKGRCAVCLEPFCTDDAKKDELFTDRPDLIKIDNCFHRFHLICVYRDWFMQRKEEIDNFGCVIKYELPQVKKCPICRRQVEEPEIVYIKDQVSLHPEVDDGGYSALK